MRKTAFFVGITAILLSAGNAFAAGNCQPVYGGGSACDTSQKLTINKTIQNPQNGQFVDSLGTNDIHFQPGQTVTFHIIVTNTGSSQIKNITIKDLFPASFQFVSGNGDYDSASHTLTFTIDSLNGNTAKTYPIQERVGDASSLPGTNPLVCLTNGATAEMSTLFGGKTLVQDNSPFCVEKTNAGGSGTAGYQTTQGSAGFVQPQPTGYHLAPIVPNQTKGGQIVYAPQGNMNSPATGPGVLGYLLLAPLGALGVALRRKSR